MKNKCIANSPHRKGERGSVLAYTVLSALFLFFAVGLGADLSHLYLAKTELQNTADAAALAGASALALPDPDRITTAVDRAVNVMNLNKYNFNNKDYVSVMSLAAQRALVEFAVNLNGPYYDEATAPDDSRFVSVQTPTVPINIFFSIPILGVQRNLSAWATAGLSVPGNVNFCPAPLAVVDCGSDNPQCLGPDGEPVSMGGECGPGGPAPNPDGTACDPTKEFCKNCVYTIRSPPAGGPAPGNYHGLCCPGVECDAEWMRQRLAGGDNCAECPSLSPGDETMTKPGGSHGGVKQGINTRFDIYNGGEPPVNPTDHPPDPNVWGNKMNDSEWLTWTQYKAGTPFRAPTNPSSPNRRVLIFPITPLSTWYDANGRDTVTVSGFGGFFIQKKVPNGNGGDDGGDIKAEYIGDEVISAIGFDPNNINTTNVVTWVLYR